MRVSGINLDGVYDKDPNFPKKKKSGSTISLNKYKNIDNLSFMPVYYPINFTSAQNSGKLRILFRYNLPCIYSGVIMIDPKEFSKLLKNGTFEKPARESLPVLQQYSGSISGVEERLMGILSARAKIHPDKNLHDLLAEIEPVYRRDLRSKQGKIFRRIEEHIYRLPRKYQNQYKKLKIETDKRLSDEYTLVPFSSYEFKYKLNKIKNEITLSSCDLKTKKDLNKLIKESKHLSNTTNSETIEHQIEVINTIDKILKKSVLKNDKQLQELIETSRARLEKKEIIIPFSRKSFLYDLDKILEDLPEYKKNEIMEVAKELPTSAQDFSAYMVKISQESSEKIASRILWPSLASIEHIHPKSKGGESVMANYAGATTRENSMRKSIDFTEQIKLRPNTPYYCQMYVNKLINLYHKGIFKKHNINPKYIEDFKNTIYEESNHQIILDISKFYEPPTVDLC